MLAAAPPANADSPNTITAFIQPFSGCLPSRVGNLYCQGPLGAPVALSSDLSANAPLWSNTAYALCWTSSAGVTLPPTADCTSTGSPIATDNDFAYSTASTFPVTFVGCDGWPSVQGNSFLFLTGSTGPCTFIVNTPDAPGFTGTTMAYGFDVVPAPAPVINGSLREATTGTYMSGRSTPVQLVTCAHNAEIGNIWVQCPGVTLTWTVTSGKRSCVIVTNSNTASTNLGTVSVGFRKGGTCTVQGSYPAVSGQSTAYSTPVYTFTVKPRRTTGRA